MLLTGTAQAVPAVGEKIWSPILISAEPLYDGSAVRLRYTEGITVVSSAGAKVIFDGPGASITTADGRRVYDRAVQVIDPHGLGRSSTADAAAYSAAGRSVYADAIAAGFSPTEARRQAHWDDSSIAMNEPPIVSSGCVYSETSYPDPDFEWSGCYKLYDVDASDLNAWYGAGSGSAHGWGTGVLGGGKELQKGYSQVTWSGSGAEIVEASPSANQSGNNCASFAIGLSHIISLSYQVPLCDDGWDVTWNQTLHKVEWHGASTGGQNDSRSASGASTVRLPWSTPIVYMNYRIGWTYACFC
ncbi:hypothetical protein O7623_21775 [Solwaraspora sp. WMMD791]|uniref:hypothetical protein n=1 Tax=Solwaraspora sp. WMMD791 TaxID=3016086 RepID=UPI00249CD6D2|nr:hypothetical protein [Solwaraspora sp. WMMD791]WFE25973.1 hypothetical protein O7623_21775 [Solwaraspora sp. WMMD791]